MKSFSLNSLLLVLLLPALGGTGGGWVMPDVLTGELIPLLDPVLKLRRFPFSCWASSTLLKSSYQQQSSSTERDYCVIHLQDITK
jgi:hypothetical protein